MARRGFAQYMEYDRGFHGWLVFFFVTACLGLLARAFILFQTGRMLRLVVGSGKGILIASVIAQLSIDLALFMAVLHGLRLFVDQDRRTPTFWGALFLASIPGTLATYALMAVQSTYYEDTTFGTALWESLRTGGLRGVLLYLAWALYWMRSKRVKLTYGSNAFERSPDRSADISAQVN
jgi:hypothetical protein